MDGHIRKNNITRIQSHRGERVFVPQYLQPDHVEKLLNLDSKVYPLEYQSDVKATLERIELNSFTDILVLHQEHLVGYISLYPIDSSVYGEIKRGLIHDRNLEHKVIPFDHVGTYCGYLSSIVIDKQQFPYYKGELMFFHLQDHLKRLRKRGVFVDRIIAYAVSQAGKNILTKMRFKECGDGIFIFSCSQQGYDFILRQCRTLLWVCRFTTIGSDISETIYISRSEWDTDT
jgi:hypothetical protein